MRQFVYILLTLVVMAGVFGSCRHTPGEAEERLIAIDSLIAIEPDSALAQLEAINADSLPADLRAYHDLLVTQAMYKAYVPASTDTLITRAWRYYADHGPYDRRIRALLYSGTVAEELGRPDSAMRWYKRTELESHADDHYHRAYALMSMAYLYQFQYIAFEKALSLHKSALHYFKLCHDNHCRLICLTEIGRLYRLVNVDSALYYSHIAEQLALSTNDTSMYIDNTASIAGAYYTIENWDQVLKYALPVINSNDPTNHQDCFFFASQAYLKKGLIDSAIYYLNHSNPLLTKDSVLYFRTRSMIESYQGNHKMSNQDAETAGSIADIAILRQSHTDLAKFANESEREGIEQNNREIKSNIFWLFVFITLFIICSVVASAWVRKKYMNLLNERNEQEKRLESARQELKEIHSRIMQQSKESEHLELGLTATNILQMQAKCIENIFKNIIYSGVRGASILKYIVDVEKSERKSLIKISIDDTFWNDLNQYVSLAFPHSFEQISREGVKLSEKEMRLVKLDILRIPNAVIAVLLGYADYSTASIRQRIYNKIGCRGQELSEFLLNKSIQYETQLSS